MNLQRPAPAADPEPRSLPSRTLRTFSVLTRLVLWLVVSVWVLFALTWGALHLLIVPRIGDWRPELERWASAAVGVPVQVGAISAQRQGSGPAWLPALVPVFELSNVRLLDPQGRAALQLPRVQATLSVGSLWRLGFEQLRIVQPVLDVRRLADGRLLVAGLDLSGPGEDSAGAEWFFNQPEFVIEDGTVRWTDDRLAQPPLALSAVNFVVRNGLRSHAMRLDGTPPAEWGERLSLRGQFTEPLLDLSLNRPAGEPVWQRWNGQLYAEFTRVDVARLRAYVDLSPWGSEVRAGQGALRAWADVAQGQPTGATLDLALQGVDARLGADLPSLALDDLHGRLSAEWGSTGFSLATEDLAFRTREGLQWPGGRINLRHRNATAGQAGSTELGADRIELAPLAAIAERLPLPAPLRQQLTELQPAGRVEGLAARWSAPGALRYAASGRVSGLALAGKHSGQKSAYGDYPMIGRPGVRGAVVRFDLDETGGTADLQVDQGAVALPGVFEETDLALDQFKGKLRWALQGERIDVWLEQASLSNADTQGTASAHWNTANPVTSGSGSRFPGELNLTARLTRADGARVHRYVPQSVAPEVRRYLREAIRGGGSTQVDFRIRGDLWDLPYTLPGTQGEFRIAATLDGVDYAFVPPYLQATGDAPWPVLKGATGRFELDRGALRLTELASTLNSAPQLRLSQASVGIANLIDKPVVVVNARAQGTAADVLGVVRSSPLNVLTGEALAQARISGPADVRFELQLPLDDLTQTRVKGSAQFTGNDVQIGPESPLLGNATGALAFSEKGFQITGGQARLYGGDARFEGGMQPDPAGGPARIQFRGTGTASAEGLRNGGLGFVSRLFAQASGSAAYTARLGFKAGVPEIDVTSNLQGLGFALPEPLAKAAATAVPLHYSSEVVSLRGPRDAPEAAADRMALDLGPASAPLLALRYERDITGAEARVLRGSIGLGLSGEEVAPLPLQGVLANARLRQVDVDAWQRVFTQLTAEPATGSGKPATSSGDSDAGQSYLPTVLAASAERASVDGRAFHQLVIGASREGNQWRANLDAREMSGYVEYRQPGTGSAGSVYARLARLALSPSDTSDVEAILQQPTSVPALDIAVEDLLLADRRLGRVEIEAVNRGGASNREWRLNRLQVALPEARFNASGNWVATSPGAPRRMALAFKLDIEDAGQLLTRFGRDGVVRGAKGRIEGHIGWQGSPFKLDYPSMAGQLQANIERGQFLKVDPGAAKLLGVLSLQALPRRLVLDFRDVFSDGFAFDFIRGDARMEQGVLLTNNLQMKGVNAAVLMEGSADLAREQQSLKVVVVPDLNTGAASLIATAINPAVGLGTFLAQYLLREPLQSAATQQFQISGSWADPQVEKIERNTSPAAAAPAR